MTDLRLLFLRRGNRSCLRRHPLAVALTIVLTVVLGSAAAATTELARFLLAKDQQRAFDRLDSDARRHELIESFWREHDPTPGTPTNELRDFYDQRARLATAHLAEQSRPDEPDDLAAVLLFFGTPDERLVEERRGGGDSGQESATGALPAPGLPGGGTTGGDPPGAGEVVVMRYTSGLAPAYQGQPLEFHLKQRGDGTWKMTFAAVDLTPEVLLLNLNWEIREEVARALAPPTPTPVAPETRALARLHQAQTDSTGDFPLTVRLFPFPAEDAKAYVVIAVGAPIDALERHLGASRGARLIGRVLVGESDVEGAEEEVASGFSIPFTYGSLDRDDGALAVRYTGLLLDPGTYRMEIGLLLEADEAAGLNRVPVVIPAFGTDLGFSALVFARKLEVSQSGAAPQRKDPISPLMDLGMVTIDPFIDPVFRPDQTPELFFIVTGTTPAGTGGELNLSVSYLFKKDGTPIVQIPAQTLRQAFIGQPLPLERLGLGEGSYELEITVKDEPSGRSAGRAIRFQVAP